MGTPGAGKFMSGRDLKKIPLFSDFSLAELAELRSAMEVERKPAGSVIIREGQEGGRDFFILVDGEVSVRQGDMVVARRRPYSPVGELAFIADRKRTATVAAETDCVLLRVFAERVMRTVERDPMVHWKLMKAVARLLCDRWAELDRRVRELLAEAPEELRRKYSEARAEAMEAVQS